VGERKNDMNSTLVGTLLRRSLAALTVLICMGVVSGLCCVEVDAQAALSDLHDFGTPSMDGVLPLGNIAYINSGTATTLYGTTAQGPTGYLLGTIYSIDLDGTDYSILYSFPGYSGDGQTPGTGLVVRSISGTNYLFGTTGLGGVGDAGTVFKFDISTSAETSTTLPLNNSGSASLPNPLMLESDGNLYGTTEHGGTNDEGTLIRVTPGTLAVTTLYDFPTASSTSGDQPFGALIEDSAGGLHGTASDGGTVDGGAGTMTKFSNPGTGWVESNTVFTGSDPGQTPLCGPAVTSSGAVYAVTFAGGVYGDGALCLKSSGGVVYSFESSVAPGSDPNCLIAGSDGNLYGTTRSGYIFEYVIGTGAMTSLYQFSGNDVYPADSSLTEVTDGSGNNWLVGVTSNGGYYDKGMVFKFGPL
jgi:uncharacterized repeat protein (TIGR03803 family)